MLFTVNVPVRLKLARRCDNFGHVCSFSGKAQRQLGCLLFKIVFFTEHTEFNMRHLLLVYWLTRSMSRTVGQTSNVGWAESPLGSTDGVDV